MSKDSTNAGYGLVMFLLGAAVGAGVALLYAPQEGGQTRRLIGEKAGEYRDKASEVTSNVTQTAKEKLNQISDKASELLNRGQQAANNALDSATDAVRETADTMS
jgi:gas vesicle protein